MNLYYLTTPTETGFVLAKNQADAVSCFKGATACMTDEEREQISAALWYAREKITVTCEELLMLPQEFVRRLAHDPLYFGILDASLCAAWGIEEVRPSNAYCAAKYKVIQTGKAFGGEVLGYAGSA